MRLIRKNPWWKSRVETSEVEDNLGCLFLCCPELAILLGIAALPILLVLWLLGLLWTWMRRLR